MYAQQSGFEKGGFSKSTWIRGQRLSERELLESLCSEIHGLIAESKSFETQYKALLRYYQVMSREFVS